MEALNLFEDICNNKCFLKSNMILFLNMRDLFAAKIKTVNIKDVCEFSDYSGPSHSYVAGTYIISVLTSFFFCFVPFCFCMMLFYIISHCTVFRVYLYVVYCKFLHSPVRITPQNFIDIM